MTSPTRPSLRTRLRRSPEAAGLLWVAPWLIGGAVFMFLPMLLSLWYSLTDYPLLKPPAYVGLANYRELGSDDRFWLVVRNTAAYAAVSIPLMTLLSLVLAAMLTPRMQRSAPGFWRTDRPERLALVAVFIPTLVPMVAAAMLWMWLFNARSGLINTALSWVGLRGPSWLEEPGWALPALVITGLWGIGQGVVIYVAALREVPTQLYEAAEIDGMGPVRRWAFVTLPMISPVILFNVITLTIGAVQVFAMPYILFRNERGQKAAGDFYNLYLYDAAFVYQRMGYASAMAWIQLLVVLGLTGLMLWMSRRLVHYRVG
ncbi:MAG: sugar ABC transporter permease [Phycisphaerales bacterium]|nr:sugar ABC transporter permease [Phycisphaerales bacterium]